MTLACVSARKRVYAKASFDARDRTGQSVLRHIAPLDRSPTVRFSLTLASKLLERMFYNLPEPSDAVNTALVTEICGRNRAAPLTMNRATPGRCADCGSDAYIQLAVGDAMLCAHCYQERAGVAKKAAGRKGGERAIPKPASVLPRPG